MNMIWHQVKKCNPPHPFFATDFPDFTKLYKIFFKRREIALTGGIDSDKFLFIMGGFAKLLLESIFPL
jgi:hypothetical protein